MGLLTKEQFEAFQAFAKKSQEEIKQFKPIIEEELKSFNDFKFIEKVCRGEVNQKGKTGDFLYQCATFPNQKYFNRINHDKRGGEADIYVCVIDAINFAMKCPRAGTSICKLRDFKFTSEKEEKEDF